MQSMILELAEFCGFNFEAQTFPQLFMFLVMAMCGTSIIAGIVKMLFWIAFNMKKLAR